jgi:hypothetical protein
MRESWAHLPGFISFESHSNVAIINGMNGRWEKKDGYCPYQSHWLMQSLGGTLLLFDMGHFYSASGRSRLSISLHIRHVLGSRPSRTRKLNKTPYAWSPWDYEGRPRSKSS